MLDFLFALGQVVSVMLCLYGGYLVISQTALFRRPKAQALDQDLEDELLLLKHLHNDA